MSGYPSNLYRHPKNGTARRHRWRKHTAFPAILFIGLLFLIVGLALVPAMLPSAEPESSADGSVEDSSDSAVSADALAEPVQEQDADNTESPSIQDTALHGRKKEMTSPVLESSADILERHVEIQLQRLSSYFSDGSYWNHIGTDISNMTDTERAMCVTDTPCAHSSNGYEYCNIYNGVMAEYFPQYDYETQCLGYASLISDLIFGLDAPVTEFYSFDDLHIGDHIRLVQNEHSMIVTDIDFETDTITVTEVNADYENCAITWNRQITREELYSSEPDVRFYTRYTD